MLGQIVLSKAGKDRGSFYAIVLEDEEFAFIADGRLRKVEKPKRKRKKHLAFTKTVLDQDALETNGKLVKALSKFNKIDEGGN
jgi:ribosomal protein L14E/L6E/L27E